MQYPKFLKNGDAIGITALSKGAGDVLIDTKKSFNHLKEEYRLIVTPNVYNSGYVSSDVETRCREFNSLLDEDICLIMNVRGGDFLYETLNGLDYKKIVSKNIWVQGYSDPTSLLYILTTKYDLATIYGFNGKSYDEDSLEDYQKNNLEILKGHIITQESYMDRCTKSLHGDFKSYGVIIGGCLDVLRYLFGTSYDGTKEFIEKYKDKGIIWYFDIYAMSSVDVYMTLLQMKNMGYFKYSNTFLFGSVLLENVDCDLSYHEAYFKALGNKNIVVDANIGHVKPSFTIINGSLANVCFKKDQLVLKQELMNENNS